MQKRDRTSKEYEVKISRRPTPAELDKNPAMPVINAQPKVRSMIHDIVSSDIVPPASVMINRSKELGKPQGMYITIPMNMFGGGSEAASLPLDIEWYSAAAYPENIRIYMANNYSFDFTPRNIIDDSVDFLIRAYQSLAPVNLNINFGEQLTPIFKELIGHPINESNETRNKYLLLAYGMTRLLFENRATFPLRSYTTMSYSGVIAASFMNRATAFHQLVIQSLKLTSFKDKAQKPKQRAFDNIPSVTSELATAATYATGKGIKTKDFSKYDYYGLQNLVLNLPDIGPDILAERVQLPLPKLPDGKTDDNAKIDMRCSYFLTLINKRRADVKEPVK